MFFIPSVINRATESTGTREGGQYMKTLAESRVPRIQSSLIQTQVITIKTALYDPMAVTRCLDGHPWQLTKLDKDLVW